MSENNESRTSVTCDEERDEDDITKKTPSALIAPALRVEELRDDERATNSSSCTSGSEAEDDDFNHLVNSDNDARKSDTPLVEETEFKIPDEELKEKINTQVEFYFSDANILKDAFLLKHVRRNKQGFVSIKLITSFRKLKALTKDFRVVAFSLKESDKLEVNDESTKVRRKDPLPDFDETTPSRSVVVVNLPAENPTIENVAELFNKCGDVALIRILRPGKSVPQDVKRYAHKHPEIGTTVCAVIEFETHESAKTACETMDTNKDDWRKGMKVVLLSESKSKGVKKSTQSKNTNENHTEKEEKKKRRRGGRKKDTDHRKSLDADALSSGSELDCRPRSGSYTSLTPNRYDPKKLSPNHSPRSSPSSSPRITKHKDRGNIGRSPLADSPGQSPRSSPEFLRKRYDPSSGSDRSNPSSPWVQRRLKAGLAQNGSPRESPLLGRKNMEGILRHPRGPDGTKGFYEGRGRGKPLLVT